MGDGHTEGDQKGKFCSLRAKGTCQPCGNKYTAPCNATMAGWEVESAGSSKFLQKYGEDGFKPSSANAHHIACVASVTAIITSDTTIGSIVRYTKWCVNDASNMIALPLWPHTFEWYVKFNRVSYKFLDPKAPPFTGLPMHDYDHDQYNKDVDTALVAVAQKVRDKKEKHKEAKATLEGQLNKVIKKFKGTLTGRKTHAGWKMGIAGKKNWYKAFSLSKSSPTEKPFPARGNDLGDN